MEKVVEEQKTNSATAALRRSEERLRTFIIASSNLIYRMNADWTRMEQLVGKELLADTPEPITGWMDKYILPEDQPLIQATIQQAIDTKSIFDLEHRILQVGGTAGWVHSRAVPLFNEQGEIIEWFGAGADITERRRTEAALRETEERYRIALQSAEMGAWDWDVEEDIVKWNDQHYYLLGLQPSDVRISSAFFLKFIHPEDLQKVSDELLKAVKESDLYNTEFRVIRSDGQVRWMNGYGRSVDKKAGKAIRLVGVMFDINHRKLLEQQKEGFISIASHELKTPVTTIKAYGELLEESLEEASDLANTELARKSNTQIERLVNLVDALLDTTKISEGGLTMNRKRFDLNDLILEHAEDFRLLSPGHTIEVNPGQNLFIQADRERIGQVLSNLVSNAIKYSQKAKKVHIDCQIQQNNVLVSVQDQGIGIAREMQEKVFERFFRVPDAKLRNYPGMGLGLYITAGIIHGHGGKIWVKSKPGEGSTFYFTLPV